MDFILNLSILNSYDYIFVILDYFIKMAHLILHIKTITCEKRTSFSIILFIVIMDYQ